MPRRVFLPPAVILGVWVCYLVWVGGDVFPWSRFWTPIIPMLACCTVLLLCRWRDAITQRPGQTAAIPRLKLGLASVILLLGIQLLTSPIRVHSAVSGNKGGAVEGVQYAAALQHRGLPPDTTIGVFLAGTTPYFMPSTTFHDFLGKCDTHIAHSPAHWGPPGHNKWDFKYSLDTIRPRYIITDGQYPAAGAATDEAMRQWVNERRDFGFHPSLWLDPLFRQDYTKTTCSVDGQVITGQDIYVRKSP